MFQQVHLQSVIIMMVNYTIIINQSKLQLIMCFTATLNYSTITIEERASLLEEFLIILATASK